MDVLSDVLRVIRLSGSVFFTARLSSPWSFESASGAELAEVLMPQAECVTLFHILVEGECCVMLDGHASFHMQSGDVSIFPHGNAHVICSHQGFTPKPLSSILETLPAREIPHVDYGGGGSACRFICGYLHCDQRFNPLLGALPPVLLVRSSEESLLVGPPAEVSARDARALRFAEADWLARTLRFTIEEAERKRPGSAAMLTRLTEIMFVEVLRSYMAQMPEQHTGWLAGVRDPEVGRVLQLLHARPEQKWTVERLAREVGRSRSALAQRFVELVGEPPMRYLAGWRMHLAKRLMRQPGLGMGEVAARVGYDSEAAFSRAFKRYVGEPPATWRNKVS